MRVRRQRSLRTTGTTTPRGSCRARTRALSVCQARRRFREGHFRKAERRSASVSGSVLPQKKRAPLGERSILAIRIGLAVYEGEQPPRIAGPDPAAQSPHSVVRWDRVNGRVYQSREYDAAGNPVVDIDFTHPTFPNGTLRPGHTVPEWHPWKVNDPRVGPASGFRRGPGMPSRPEG